MPAQSRSLYETCSDHKSGNFPNQTGSGCVGFYVGFGCFCTFVSVTFIHLFVICMIWHEEAKRRTEKGSMESPKTKSCPK